jgi:hypothetical protein
MPVTVTAQVPEPETGEQEAVGSATVLCVHAVGRGHVPAVTTVPLTEPGFDGRVSVAVLPDAVPEAVRVVLPERT